MTAATATRVDTDDLSLVDVMPASLPAVMQQGQMVQQPARVVTPADLLNIAMQSGDKDIERLERLMQMDIRYRELQQADREREQELAFEASFVGVTGENIVVPKSKHVDRGRAGSFFQAEFDSVCKLIKPALAKHGFGIRHKETFGAKTIMVDGEETTVPWVWVVCILSHQGGHKETLELDGPADAQSANTPTQNAQSTASYLKRQSMLAITGTPTGGEDDEARTSKLEAKDPEGTTEHAKEGDPLLTAGWVEARKGVQPLTTWWGSLTEGDRKRLMPHFGDMKRESRKVAQ